jgi:hypothetical protein
MPGSRGSCARRDGPWRRITLAETPQQTASPATRDEPREAASAEPASRNIAAIASLEREAMHERTRLDHVTDAVTAVAGSAAFLVLHAVWFAVWIAINLGRDARIAQLLKDTDIHELASALDRELAEKAA